MLLSIFCLLFKITSAFVLLIQKPNIINTKHNRIKMDYDIFKDYDDVLNFLPTFQASIIINNWLSYIKNENSENNNDIDSSYTYMNKSIYDMKVYIAITRQKNDKVLLAWSPEYSKKRSIAYIAGCQIANNTLFIERIAQNPYYSDILKLKSRDFFNEVNKVINTTDNINKVSLDKLNTYDSRYWLSLLIDQID